MKVFALVILALGSVAARGSGPYLPSGWRPDGPAFYLPAEQKPAENPLKDIILQGSEASGSEALREYGPPKVAEVSQDLIKQGLPDVAIEQNFNEIKQDVVEAVVETVNLNEAVITSVAEETVTESQDNEATTLEAVVPILIIDPTTETESAVTNAAELEATSESIEASTSYAQDSDSSANSIESVSQEFIVNSETETPVTEGNIAPILEVNVDSEQKLEQAVEQEVEKLEQVVEEVQEVEQEVKNVEQSAQNIPDALAYLENGIKQVELAQAQVDATILENSGTLEQAPEGFLEYGPPGFREYGPPKDDLAKISSEPLPQADSFVSTNEVRRRRFSPKFRPARLH